MSFLQTSLLGVAKPAVYCKVGLASSQAMTPSVTTTIYDTWDDSQVSTNQLPGRRNGFSDNRKMYDPKTGIFTIPESGLYLVVVNLEVAAGTNSSDGALVDVVSNTNVLKIVSPVGVLTKLGISDLIFFNAGQKVYVRQSNTDSKNLDGNFNNTIAFMKILDANLY